MAKSKNRLQVLLFVSVLVNVFLIGYVVSFYQSKPMDHRPPPPHGGGPVMQFEKAKQGLSGEGQGVVERVLDAQRSALRVDMDEMRDYIDAAERLLLAEEFDEVALHKAHENIDKHQGKMKANLSDLIYQIAVELSPEDRIEFFSNALPKRPPPRR